MIVESGERWIMILGDWRDCEMPPCDHLITDPPYTKHVHNNQRTMRKKDKSGKPLGAYALSFDAIDSSDLIPAIEQSRRWSIIFCAMEVIGEYGAFDRFVRGCVWIKPDGAPQFTGDRPAMWGESIAVLHAPGRKRWNAGGKRGVYTHLRAKRKMRIHETPKPVGLMREIIEDFTSPDDLIWDPYAGEGTTGVAAISIGRYFVGNEIDETYFLAACDRLRDAEKQTSLNNFARQQRRSKQQGLL